MNSTDDKEKNNIIDWATKNQKQNKYWISNCTNKSDSLWNTYNEQGDICEYGFNTVPELKKLLKENMMDEIFREIDTTMCVAAFKKKAEKDRNKAVCKSNHSDEFSIPEFIYVF